MKIRPIQFPQDELPHDTIIEWWYFNGNLKDERGKKYSFMDCLFKADSKRVKIPFLKSPFKRMYFSHSLLSDIENKKFYSEINPVSILSKDSFSRPLLFINYTQPPFRGYVNYAIDEIEKFKYHIKTENIDLILISKKKPLLEGGDGYLDLKRQSTYYYSLTNLETNGKINIEGRWIDVTGKSWMDHQWADVSYTKFKWTWFSIQLDNDIEMVCFEYVDDRNNKTYLADICYPNNEQKHFSRIELKPLGEKWTSKRTEAVYPLSWEIKVPSEEINLKVYPLIKNQEMIFGTINYWEGPLEITGLFNNKKVKGEGFMELVGYPKKISNVRLYEKEIKKKVREAMFFVTKSGMRTVKGTIKKITPTSKKILK